MKVALVLETAGGGSGRHVVDLASGLRAGGVDTTIVYWTHRAEPTFVAAAGATGATLVALDRWWQLRGALRRLAPDVVHAHSSIAGVVARATVRRPPWTVVYTPHAPKSLDPNLKGIAGGAVRTVERVLANARTDCVIAVSQDEAAHLAELGVAPGKIHVVRNGIEAPARPAGDARAALGLAADAVVVGWVGRMVPQKDPLAFVRWCAEVRTPFMALMVGDGPLLPAVRAEVTRLGLDDVIRTPGAMSGAAAMEAMDVFCLSSRYEGMPYVLIEAAHAGLPIVATRTGGANEVVVDGVTGYLVDEADAPNRIADLVGDPGRRARFAAASAVHATHFVASQMVSETLLIYRAGGDS
ncbi:MAG TPA: glycosyltransferase family 4 protein [Acidimicrobiales bacterium]|nr:glycosyltransferase family 4 protein [Acidimicrobiales bacterium]